MKRILSLAAFAALLAVGAPLGAARAADLDPPARSSVHHGHNYTDKCQARLERCTKWFASNGDWCQKRHERCEAHFARWHERRVAHYEMRQNHAGGHHMKHRHMGHHAMGHHEMGDHKMAHREHHAMDRHHMRGDHAMDRHHMRGGPAKHAAMKRHAPVAETK